MAESGKTLTLAEQYALPKEELSSAKVPVEATAAASPTNVAAEASPTNVAAEDKANPIITTTNVEDVVESPASAVAEEVVTENPTNNSPEEVAVESVVSPTTEEVVEKTDEIAPAEDSKEAPEEEAGEEVAPEIKLETAPADFRFPTTNQSRHCFTRYVEYHRCIAAKGESAPECDKFAKYYRSLCPGEWVDRWNEQRENGTFPGPL